MMEQQQNLAAPPAATYYCGMNDQLAVNVIRALEAHRDARRLSELAEAAGLPTSTLTRIISGEYSAARTDYARAIRGALVTLAKRYRRIATAMDGQAKLITKHQRRGKR